MRNLPILVLALALAACGSDKKDEGAGKAEGQILSGSASDAMLPLDTVRSQAPLAPKAAAAGQDAKEAEATATDAADVATAAAPVEAPEPVAAPAG
jgi:hypothetical protein